MLVVLLETAIVILMSLIIWQSLKKPYNYPPGPWGLPFIGYIPSGFNAFVNTLKRLRRKNDVISWRIGSKLITVIFDYNLIKEAYNNPAVNERPDIKSVSYLQGEQVLGIGFCVGERWRNNRRLSLRHLRDFGMGKTKLLLDAHFESDNLITEMRKQVGKSAPISHCLLISILNIVWEIVGGKRYDFDDKEILYFCDLIHENHLHGSKLIVLDVFPWIKKIVPEFLLNKIFKFHVQMDLSNNIKNFFTSSIEEHIKDLDVHNPRDFIDAYLIEMKKDESNPSSLMSVEDLAFCVADLFAGATETTSLSIHWAILYLSKFSPVQTKLQNEVDEFLPKGTPFAMSDKIRLPYTEAFIHEVLRYSTVVPLAPRAANSDTKIGDYFIPKGTVVIYNGVIVHSDPKYFDSPEEFRPERFLDSDGKFSAPRDGFLPFGLGNRVCIGEAIARMNLFVFITKFVQNFSFEFPPGEEFDLEAIASPFFRPPKGSPNVIIRDR